MTALVSGPTPPTPPQITAMAEHVDHEMSRLLWIGETLRCWRWLLPDTILRAMRVAYAAHARVLLEFFHDGRPRSVGVRTAHGGDVDVWVSDYTGKTAGTNGWTADHEQRLTDADKLLAHLSTGRLAPPRAHLPEWGDAEDRARFRPIIEQVMAEVLDAATRFPGTHRALAETRR